MNRITVTAVVLLVFAFVSCATLKEKPADKTEAMKQELPEERTAKKKNPLIYGQDGKDTWVWAHDTKGEDEFALDYDDCKPSRIVVDTYLTEDEKNLGVSYYILMLSATNKCMVSKGWRTEKQKTGEAAPQ
jgi:hypothetical protein